VTLPHLAVVNPAAGGGRCGKQFPAAVQRLREAGVEVDIVETTGPGEACEIVRDAWASGRRRFIGVGGDGTGYEIVNGLFPAASGAPAHDRPSLGFLPLGTGNSFLRDFTDRGVDDSLPAILDGRARPCDVIRLEHDDGELHYINLLSIGFVADVNGRRARKYKAWGELGYIFAVVAETFGLRPRPYPMRADGGDLDNDAITFASFNNSKFTGGKMMMAPEADTADGRIAYVRVGPLGRISLLRTFPKIFKGTHVLHPAVSQSQVEAVEFDLDGPIDVMVDGEALQVRPRRLSVLPGALRVQV
jgi:diacylglycerol kinase (ATP)